MLLLGKMHDRILMEKPAHKNDCYTHECEHCGMWMKLPWKVKGTYENKGKGGGGIYHTVHAGRLLESHCNEAGRISIKERLLEKSVK